MAELERSPPAALKVSDLSLAFGGLKALSSFNSVANDVLASRISPRRLSSGLLVFAKPVESP